MQLSAQQYDDLTVLKVLESRLDAANAPELRAEVSAMIESGVQRLILDISAVEFMDSSSLGAMVSILKMVSSSGELTIAGAKGIVADLFKLTRMDRVFQMAEDVDVAVDLMAVA